MRARIRAALLASCLACAASPSTAQDATAWHALEVPGGRATLKALGVADTRERPAVMVELTRRFMFATTSQAGLEAALRAVPARSSDTLILPLPLSPAKWSAIVFQRTIPSSRLFSEILLNPSARLLFHGLAGLDHDTLKWIEGEDELLRRLYRNPDALKSFALFAPAVRVSNGRVDLAGGAPALQRWPAILDARPEQPSRFVGRLFADRAGRTAGLFAITSFADEARRGFLLGASDHAFARLVSGFAQCYPAHANDYPLALRSYDPALLLMDIAIAGSGRIDGPSTARFWQRVFDSKDLAGAPPASELSGDSIDAAGLVDRLCAASTPDRAETFATLLAGPRVFRNLDASEWPDAVLALRVRRQFPAVFMAIEQAGLRRPAAFVAAGRHALRLDRLTDEGAAIALRQFQGALALTLNAAAAHTFDAAQAERLVAGLSSVPFKGDRYDGGISNWMTREWLPAAVAALRLKTDLTAEQIAAAALAGPSPVNPARVNWEDVDYVVDFPASTRQRLREVRARQGGPTLDQALAASATESQLAQVLASWAYAPHLGAADGGALVGGDSSVRHDVGLRAVNRTRFEQRWEVSPRAGERGAIAGSYLGLVAPLANWSLRRLASDRIPPPPTIGDNDLSSLFLTAALSDPTALTDRDMTRIASSIAAGSRIVEQAGADADRLTAAARAAGMSPWRAAMLPWMIAAEPERIAEQFSLSHRARLGGLRAEEVEAWGTASLSSGCLCLRMPPARIPELVAGRPADGIVAGQSADLMLRIAMLLSELRMPAALAAPVLSYAMRDFLDAVRPSHPADFEAFSRQAPLLDRMAVEDYLGAIAAVGALRPTSAKATVGKLVVRQ